MNQLETMQIFVHVVELASFTRAAELLSLPKGSISTRIAKLENHMGTRLLHRTTRRVELTQDGQIFYERCKDLLAEAADIEAMFQHDPTSISGRLRVDMVIIIATDVVIPRLPEFLAAHPNIEFELSATDRRVDLVGEGFDCVVRVGHLNDSSLIARPLGELTLINCASPEYIQIHGEPKTIADLSTHTLVHYTTTFGARKGSFDYVDNGQNKTLKLKADVTVNNVEAYTAAALAGLGIIQTSRTGVQAHLDSGRLVEILPQCRAEPLPVSLVYPNRRNVARRVQVFMEWMQTVMRDYVR